MFFSVYSYVSSQEIIYTDMSDTTDTLTSLSETTFVIPYIMVIGHSWAYGAFHNYNDFFKNYNINIDENTQVGTSLQWTLENVQSLPENKYNALCIFSGINDYRYDVNYIAEKFVQIFQEGFKKANVLFVFNIPDYPPASEKVKVLNEWLSEMAKINEGLIIIDINKEIELQKSSGFKMSADELHPSSYDVVQDLFIYVVQKYFYNKK